MAKRYQPSQRDKLQEHFHDHVYYRLCKIVYNVFRRHTPSINMSAEELFSDASGVLDNILTSGDKKAEKCNELWSDTLREYRKLDGNSAGSLESQTEVAMLVYAVMLGLQSVGLSHYRGKLQRTLHGSIHQMWDKGEQKNCMEVEADLKAEVNELKQEMLEWMATYFTSSESLSKEIESVLRPVKSKGKGNTSTQKEKVPVLYTLNYLCEDESLRIKRIGFVRRKWEEWEWLKTNTDVDDFEHFFSGKPRDCQLIWKASNAILSLMLAQLLEMKDCFGHITRCSPRSVVINQFKKSYDTHKERVDDLNRLRIDWTVKLLNYKVSLELPQLSYCKGEDISDKALQEVFAGNMHITKELNKYKD